MFPLIVKLDIENCRSSAFFLVMNYIFRFYSQLRDLAKSYKCNIMRSNLPGTTLALLKLHTLKT